MKRLLSILALVTLFQHAARGQMFAYTAGTGGNAFPLNTTTSNLCQFLYQPSNFPGAPAGNITKIYVMANTAVTAASWNNLTVKMGTTTATAFTTGPFTTGLTTVYTAPVTTLPAPIPARGWFEITLQNPFPWGMTSNLIVEISQTGYTGGLTIAYNSAVAGARLYGSVTGTTGTAGGGLMNMGIDLATTPCAGVPVPGAAVSSPASPCLGSTAVLSLTPASLNTGIAYQWEEFDGTNWINVVGGVGPTASSYVTPPVMASKRYRAKLVCTNGPSTPAYSTEVIVAPSLTALPYTETFEGITAADQLPPCMRADNLGSAVRTYIANQTSYNRNNHTTGGSKFASFYYSPAGQHGIYTPALTLQAGKTYLFSFWYVVGNATNNAPGTFTALEAYYGTSPNVASMTNLIGAVPASPVSNTTYQQFAETFTPTTTGVYYLGIMATHTASTVSYLSVDDLGVTELLPCSGMPTAGTILPPTPPCPNEFFQLSHSGTQATSASGLTIRWQDSSAAGWQYSVGTTATRDVFTTSITAATTYRAIVTCTNSGQSDTTPSYTVNLAPFLRCYCVPTYATGSTVNTIRNVQLKTLNNASTGASPWYMDYTGQQPSPIPIPSLTMGVTDTLKVTFSTNTTNYSAVWIDFNHNGIFDVSEYFSQGTNAGASGIANILITPPLTAQAGRTRMRIRGGDRAAVMPLQACDATSSAYGEAEDYYVNIDYPPCSGPVNAGNAEASEKQICIGYTVNVWDTTYERRRSQIVWTWENSYDGGLSWNDVPGSTGKDTLNNVLITGAVVYRLRIICNVSGDTTYSTPATITIKPPYMCYCYSQSEGGNNDVSDIGSVVIHTMVNSTGGPHISNPTAIRRRTDYTDIPNIILHADGTYRLSIYHIQRNPVHHDARISVFIDFNNDLRYDAMALPASERVYSDVTRLGYFYLDTVMHIPNAVIPNVPTGFRVILNEDLNPNSPANLGCGPYMSGETEDYVVMFRREPSGVGSIRDNLSFSLYPNPTANGRFTISATGEKALDQITLTVTNLTGQTVLRERYNNIGQSFMQTIGLADAAKGVYFVELRTASGAKEVRKLVLQ